MNKLIFILLLVSVLSCTNNDSEELPANKKVATLDKAKTDETLKPEPLKENIEAKYFEAFFEGLVKRDTLLLFDKIDFPITVSGSLDSDQRIQVNKTNFYQNFWSLFLEEEVVCGFSLIKNKDIYETRSCFEKRKLNENLLKFNKLVFEKIEGKWLLKEIFSEVYLNQIEGTEKFTETFNASINHWTTYPISWNVEYDDRVDADSFYTITNADTTIEIKKWVQNSKYFNSENYLMKGDSILGYKFDLKEVFNAEINEFSSNLRNRNEELISFKNQYPTSIIKSKVENYNIIYKAILISDQYGNTIIIMRIKFTEEANINVIDKIIEGFKKGGYLDR